MTLGEGVLDDLLGRAFPNRTTLHVHALTPGLSGAAVLHVKTEQVGAQHPCVIKIGPTGRIFTEHERWREFVQPYLGHGEMPDVLCGPVVVGEHAGIVYKFYALQTLAGLIDEMAMRGDSIGIMDAVGKLLGMVHVWHRSRSSMYFDLIAEEYPLDDAALGRFEHFTKGEHDWGTILDAELVREVWSNPPEALRNPQLVAISHGDLHADNVLVGPNGSFGVIDFFYTGKHHFLRDLATLEADLVARVLSPRHATANEARQLTGLLEPYYRTQAFATPTQQDLLSVGQHLPLQNAVRALRSAVWGRAEHDPSQIHGYLVAVIRRMLRMVVSDDSQLTAFQRWLTASLVAVQAAELARSQRSSRLPSPVSGERRRQRVTNSQANQQTIAYLDLESEMEVIIGRLSKLWQPRAVGPIEAELTAIADDLRRGLQSRNRHLALTFDALVEAYPEPMPDSAPNAGGHAVGEINRVLARLASNRLAEVRVLRKVEEGLTPSLEISCVDVASLLSHSPHGVEAFHPTLRAAFGLYDAGSYSAALKQFSHLAAALSDGLTLTRSELALFFYYLSKCLLKLNMYGSLLRCVDGPYRAFSAAVCPELESERLVLAGVAYRHQGEFGLAQACIDDAINQLILVSEASSAPVALLSLADAYVLSAHPRFDQAAISTGTLAQQASLRSAATALKQAERTYEMYWKANGQASHYEGRLSGTIAYMTVMRSIIEPNELDADAWASAEATRSE